LDLLHAGKERENGGKRKRRGKKGACRDINKEKGAFGFCLLNVGGREGKRDSRKGREEESFPRVL